MFNGRNCRTKMLRSVTGCVLIGIMLQVLFPFYVSSSKCWMCSNAASFTDCKSMGNITECGDTEVCSTEVRKYYNDISIWKGCKQRKACENQRLQNWERTPYTCNNDQDISHCWCCCDNDSCNKNETCEVNFKTCPMPLLHMEYGKVACSNANQLGSLCTYQCTEKGYTGLPINKQDRLCLGNGKWSEKKPCCIKECPPYVPLDLVALVHYTSEDSQEKRVTNIGPSCSTLVQTEEYYQAFRVYFNEKVYKVVRPDDTDRLGHFQPSASNTANTGAALRYIRQNIFRQLPRRRSHSVIMGVEKESDDNAALAAAELKNGGVTIYYVFFESKNHKVNWEEARSVASSEEHIFVVDGGNKMDFKKVFDDVFSLACNLPCPNAEDE